MNFTIVRTLNNQIEALADRVRKLENTTTTTTTGQTGVKQEEEPTTTGKKNKRWEKTDDHETTTGIAEHLHAIEQRLGEHTSGYRYMSPKSKRICLEGVSETVQNLQKLEHEMRAIDAKQEEKKRMHDLADNFTAYIHSIPAPKREPHITLGFVANHIAPWIHQLPLTYFEATVRFLQRNTGASSWTRDQANAFIIDVTAALEKDRSEIDMEF